MMPITTTVQSHADEERVQLSSKSSVSATGTKLRRRLSKIFHWDSAVSGFFLGRVGELAGLAGTRRSSHDAICQSPRIQRCRRLTSAL